MVVRECVDEDLNLAVGSERGKPLPGVFHDCSTGCGFPLYTSTLHMGAFTDSSDGMVSPICILTQAGAWRYMAQGLIAQKAMVNNTGARGLTAILETLLTGSIYEGLISMDPEHARNDPVVVKNIPYYKTKSTLETEVMKLNPPPRWAGSSRTNYEVPKPSPKSLHGENLDCGVDEEEMELDKLLSRYNKKLTHILSTPTRPGSLPSESVATSVFIDERKKANMVSNISTRFRNEFTRSITPETS
ncbi:embryo defective protein [Artemisia annua]|uniref:Embryo defective protein n=1 Tax=Artemisia annua TaxID=35608 RepID=A0A2U1L9Z1_ARTAN|nr:embryo defective protein [Artemisia annua]